MSSSAAGAAAAGAAAAGASAAGASAETTTDDDDGAIRPVHDVVVDCLTAGGQAMEPAQVVKALAPFVDTTAVMQRAAQHCPQWGPVLNYWGEDEDEDEEGRLDPDDDSAIATIARELNDLRAESLWFSQDYCRLKEMQPGAPLFTLDGSDETFVLNVSHDRLLPLCPMAGYGDLRTMTTVHDESVRKARASPFRLVTGDEATTAFLAKLGGTVTQMTGLPDTAFELREAKVNLYEVGGHFKPHVDTPTDPDRMLGTVVVLLPQAHKGGKLVVEPPLEFGAPQRVRSNNGYQENRHELDRWGWGGDQVRWAAFYSDCPHQVEPVTEGVRVTMSFDILHKAAEDGEVKQQQQQQQQQQPVRKRLLDTVEQERYQRFNALAAAISTLASEQANHENKPTAVAVTAAHCYTLRINEQCEDEQLKGVDREAVRALRQTLPDGWSVHLQTVLDSRSHRTWHDFGPSDIKSTVVPLTEEHLKAVMGGGGGGSAAGDGLWPEWWKAMDRVVIVQACDDAHQTLKQNSSESCAYTGNQAAPGHYEATYFSTLIVCVPPVGVPPASGAAALVTAVATAAKRLCTKK